MSKCLVCGAPLPEGVEYCPPAGLREYGRTCGFRGCYSIRTEALRMPRGSKRNAPKFKTNRQLGAIADIGRKR